jgi:hypothetical protein
VDEDGEEQGGGVFGVVGPAQVRGAPELKEISQADRTHKSENGGAVAGGAEGNQDTRQGCQDGEGFVDGRSHKGQHSGEENGEDNPVENDPQLARVLGQDNT